MSFFPLPIKGCGILSFESFEDERGSFRRNFCVETLAEFGLDFTVRQGNLSHNIARGTLRGFHYQRGQAAESKLVSVVSGSIFNVIADVRSDSPTFGDYYSCVLTPSEGQCILVSAGCANAFLTLSPNTNVHYYMNADFDPSSYCGFRYDDSLFDVTWPFEPSVISQKDLDYPSLLSLNDG